MNINFDIKAFECAKFFVKECIAKNPNMFSSNPTDEEINQLARNFLMLINLANEWQKSANIKAIHPSQNLSEEVKTSDFVKKTFSSVSVESEPTSQVFSPQKVDLPTYTFANQDWSDIEVVQKAKGGVRGAWFYSHSAKGSVVVKGQENAEQQIIGTAFLRCMGINAPDAKMVDRHSFEGKQLSDLGESHGLNAREPSHYIVMDRIYGKAYADLIADHETFLVTDNLEQLGELAVYDLLLGNYDRFQLNDTSFNAGNIMFQDNQLCPIDTDCISQDETLQFTKFALKKIIKNEGNFDNKIAIKLAKFLGSGVSESLISCDKIKTGMQKAISRLRAFDEMHKQQFIECCRERGCELTTFPKHLDDLLLYINSVN